MRKSTILNWVKFSSKLIDSAGFVLFTAINRNKIGNYVVNTFNLKKNNQLCKQKFKNEY